MKMAKHRDVTPGPIEKAMSDFDDANADATPEEIQEAKAALLDALRPEVTKLEKAVRKGSDPEDDDEDEDEDGDEKGEVSDKAIAALAAKAGKKGKKKDKKPEDEGPPSDEDEAPLFGKGFLEAAREHVDDETFADELVEGVFKAFADYLAPRDAFLKSHADENRKLRRDVRKAMEQITPPAGTPVEKSVGEPESEAPKAAPRVSPGAAQAEGVKKSFTAPAGGEAVPMEQVSASLNAAAVEGRASASEVISLTRAYGTEDWSEQHQARYNELTATG
jgi:hypothetical protein